MRFPERASTHITETQSWKIFQNKMPADWIIREVTERDYGIDSYVEIVWNNRQLTGDLCSVQLKGTTKLAWTQDVTRWGNRVRFSGIDKATVNYWMSLPLPVFLMWAEIDTGELYFAPVKEQVRKSFSLYLDDAQQTLGFDFYSEFSMGSQKGDFLFFVAYLKEKGFTEFSRCLADLLIHWNQYYDFIVDNQCRDCFLEVEDERQLMLMHIYRTCETLSQFLGVKWSVTSLHDAYQDDLRTFQDRYCPLHEKTLDNVLQQIQPLFVDILENSRRLVVETQAQFWKEIDRPLYMMCTNLHTQNLDRGNR